MPSLIPEYLEFELASGGPVSYGFPGGDVWVRGKIYATEDPAVIRLVLGSSTFKVVHSRGSVPIPKMLLVDPTPIAAQAARSVRAGVVTSVPSATVAMRLAEEARGTAERARKAVLAAATQEDPAEAPEGLESPPKGSERGVPEDVPEYDVRTKRDELLQIAGRFGVELPGDQPSKAQIVACLDEFFATRREP